MSVSTQSAAVGAALAHIEAWSNHYWEASRAGLATDVWVTAHNTDLNFPVTDLNGPDAYMKGLMEFAQAVVPGSAAILAATGDDKQALVTLNVRVKFGPDAPEMTLPGARAYLFDDENKIRAEHVVFFVTPS
jgi:hypothetical protein